MPVEAPPRPPEQDELDALIEEARRRARRRRLGYLGLAVAAATAAGLLFLMLGGSGDGGGPQGSASNASAGPSGIQYTRTTQLTLAISGNYSYYQPHVYEAWVRPDGSGYLRTIERPAEWPGPRDRARAVTADDQDALDRTREPSKVLQDGELSADALGESWSGSSTPPVESLSSHPSDLRDQLESSHSGETAIDVRVFESAAFVLLNPETDASVRAAAFEVIGRLPKVTIDRSASDPLGRRTTSASVTSAYSGQASTRTVYFDPQSSRAFAYTDKLTQPANFIDSRTLTSIVMTDAKKVSSIR